MMIIRLTVDPIVVETGGFRLYPCPIIRYPERIPIPMKRIMLATVAISMIATAVLASEGSPINLSLWDTIQIVNKDESVKGFRLGIYARNVNMTGFDMGIFERTDGEFKGVQFAAANLTAGDATGWQVNFVGIVKGKFTGLQGGIGANAIFNSAGSTHGVQFGWINRVEGHMNFLQLGLVNIADNANGIQIGLFNMISSKEKFSWLPIVNWQF